MYDDADHELERFFSSAIEFIGVNTDFKAFEKMSEESRKKWIEKLTIMVCYEFAPRRNYDISKDTIRLLVIDVIDSYRGASNE